MLFSAGFNRDAGFAAQMARNPKRANACITSDYQYQTVMASWPLGVAGRIGVQTNRYKHK